MTDPQIILRRDHGSITVLTLNRPDRMNALSGSLSRALDQHLQDCCAPNSHTRAIVLTGAGRGFCAGADLSEKLPVPEGSSVLETWYHPTIHRLHTCPIPIVAAINGVAAGAGMSLALLADIIICGQSASFLQAFVKAGLVPDCGSSWLLSRRIGETRAREMALLAERVSAQTALDWGLVNRVVLDEDLQEQALDMARKLADGPINALSRTRSLFAAAACNDFATQMQFEDRMQRHCSGGAESNEGRTAFLEKRKPDFSQIGLSRPAQTP